MTPIFHVYTYLIYTQQIHILPIHTDIIIPKKTLTRNFSKGTVHGEVKETGLQIDGFPLTLT